MIARCILFAWAALLALLAPAFAADVTTVNMGKGVEVWFVEDHTLPIISMTVSLPAGSGYDPAGKAGLATFASAMLDEGAGPYNSQAYQTALSDRGIRLSASADHDWTTIRLVTLKENAKDAFRLLGVALSKPRFDPDAVARVRAQILAGLQQNEEDPASVAVKGFYARFFPGHPYGPPVLGTAASVSTISRNDLRDFARTHWVRGGMHIAVSGDVDVETLKSLIASAFRTLPLGAPAPIPPVRRMGTPGVQVIPMAVPQPNIIFGMPALPRKDRDFIPLYVANYILGGGGFSSRLTTEVREKRGLTYDISTSVSSLNRAAFFAGLVATKAGSVNETIKIVRQTIADFAANGPTQQELDDAKTYLTGSFPLAFASNVGISDQLNAFQNQGLPVGYIKDRNNLINAVTVDDVRRALKRVFAKGKLTIVVAGTPKTEKSATPPLPGAEKPPAPSQMPKKALKPTPLPEGKKPTQGARSVAPKRPAPAKETPQH
ncbi:MAG TPA: insulinase family protein [Rhizomicrobium sp.]|nr:insulinase family protein [Rhizomicrobium sp.]